MNERRSTRARWPIVEHDLLAGSGPLLAEEQGSGVAMIIRRGSIPVGFALVDPLPGARGHPDDFACGFDPDLPVCVMEAAIREELPPARPSPSTCRVTVAICTRDRPEWLERLLDSMAALERSPALWPAELETLVVDNAPSDERSRDVVSRFPDARYVVEPRAGLNFARNQALREARGEVVAYLDDDVVVDRRWLAGLVAAYQSDPQAGFITGQVLPLELATDAQLLFERRGGFRRGFRRIHYGQMRPGDAFYPCGAGIFGTGANMAVNRAAALAIGGFDEALDTGRALPGGGDLDMFYRLIRAGYRATYDPCCLVRHQHRRELQGLRRQYQDSWGRAYMAFAVKSLRADPAMRNTWLRHIGWWFSKQSVHLIRRLSTGHPRPASLILAETWGGLAGLLGAYDRSCASTARIRAEFD